MCTSSKNTNTREVGRVANGNARYRLAVPPVQERPPVFTLGPDADLTDPNTPRIPLVTSCHCDSCRATSGNMTTQCIMAADYMVTVSVLPRKAEEEETRAVAGRIMEPPTSEDEVVESDKDRPPYVPAVDVLRAGVEGSKNTWLHFFHSFMCNEYLSRSFCGRCGSPVSVHYQPSKEFMGPMFVQPEGWTDVVDLFLGSVDKHILNKEDWLEVRHELNFECAVDWAKKKMLSGSAQGTTFHDGFVMGKKVERGNV